MSKVNFYLDKPKTEKETPVLMYFSFDGNRIKFSTGETILPKEWNSKKQCARSSYTGHVEFNLRLDKLKEDIKKIYRESIINEMTPTASKIKQAFEEREGRIHRKNFFEVINDYICDAEISKTTGSVKKYKTINRHLHEYCAYRKKQIGFDDIDLNFFDDYRYYLLCVKGHTNNTVVKNIKIVKSFLNYATDRGYNRNLEFKKFKSTEKDGDVIFLTFDELIKVFRLELKEQRLQRVRDIFCLSCFTGLRYSDVTRIKPENIVDGSIIIRSQKTKDTLTIPLNSYAKEILSKYKDTADTCIPHISIQKLNDYLKEIGKLAQLNSSLTVTRYRGAEKIETTKPKYEFLTSHIGRKTFVTNSLYFGMKTEILMDITGHKTHSAFKRYYKIIDSIRKSEMNRTWDKQLA